MWYNMKPEGTCTRYVVFVSCSEIKENYLILKLRIIYFFINSKFPGMSNCIHVYVIHFNE